MSNDFLTVLMLLEAEGLGLFHISLHISFTKQRLQKVECRKGGLGGVCVKKVTKNASYYLINH